MYCVVNCDIACFETDVFASWAIHVMRIDQMPRIRVGVGYLHRSVHRKNSPPRRWRISCKQLPFLCPVLRAQCQCLVLFGKRGNFVVRLSSWLSPIRGKRCLVPMTTARSLCTQHRPRVLISWTELKIAFTEPVGLFIFPAINRRFPELTSIASNACCLFNQLFNAILQ